MHHGAWRFVERVSRQISHVATAVLEIGARDINGSVRPLFASATHYLGIDLVDGPGVDLVADGATVSPLQPVNCVVCCEVLEHSDEAEHLIAHALDLLPRGGHLVVTCAAPHRAPHSAIDGGVLRDGEYYANVVPTELEHWVVMHGGEPVVLIHDQTIGDLYLWARKAS